MPPSAANRVSTPVDRRSPEAANCAVAAAGRLLAPAGHSVIVGEPAVRVIDQDRWLRVGTPQMTGHTGWLLGRIDRPAGNFDRIRAIQSFSVDHTCRYLMLQCTQALSKTVAPWRHECLHSSMLMIFYDNPCYRPRRQPPEPAMQSRWQTLESRDRWYEASIGTDLSGQLTLTCRWGAAQCQGGMQCRPLTGAAEAGRLLQALAPAARATRLPDRRSPHLIPAVAAGHAGASSCASALIGSSAIATRLALIIRLSGSPKSLDHPSPASASPTRSGTACATRSR